MIARSAMNQTWRMYDDVIECTCICLPVRTVYIFFICKQFQLCKIMDTVFKKLFSKFYNDRFDHGRPYNFDYLI